jgi:hypothetical protein
MTFNQVQRPGCLMMPTAECLQALKRHGLTVLHERRGLLPFLRLVQVKASPNTPPSRGGRRLLPYPLRR